MNKQKLNNYCVYAHINQQNGKIYIGITKDIAKRWIPSAYKFSPFFNKAIKKYGWDNFDHIILINNITKPNIQINLNGFTENDVIPSQAKLNIFFNGYFDSPAKRSFLS